MACASFGSLLLMAKYLPPLLEAMLLSRVDQPAPFTLLSVTTAGPTSIVYVTTVWIPGMSLPAPLASVTPVRQSLIDIHFAHSSAQLPCWELLSGETVLNVIWLGATPPLAVVNPLSEAPRSLVLSWALPLLR